MAVAYDYIVTFRVTEKGGAPEEYRVPIMAYSAAEALTCAMVELNAEHGFVDKGVDLKVLSVRPDVAKIGEQTRAMVQEMAKSLKGKW